MTRGEMNLGWAIKWERMRLGVTQPQMAKSIGISVTWLSNIEAKGARPSMDLLGRIADFLNTTPLELLRKATSLG